MILIQTSGGWIGFVKILINNKGVRLEAYSGIHVFIFWRAFLITK